MCTSDVFVENVCTVVQSVCAVLTDMQCVHMAFM